MQKRSTFVESLIQAVKLPLIFLVVLTMSISQAFANLAFVTNFTSGTVSVIDTSTNMIVGSPIPVGLNPEGIAITPDGKFAYVANTSSIPGTVSVININDLSAASTTIPGVGNLPLAIAITPNGKFAYVTNAIVSGGTVTKIDLSTNMVVTGIGYPIVVGNDPRGIAITPDGLHVYVANGGGGIDVIQTSDDTVIAPSPIAVGSGPFGIAITPDGSFVYNVNANPPGNNVSVIQTSDNMVVGSPITVGTTPTQLAISPDGRYVFVANFNSASVSVIDRSMGNTVVATIPVGSGPRGIAFTPDGKFAYVATFNFPDQVTVINTSSLTVSQQITSGGSGPFGIAITPTITPPPPPPPSSSPSSPKNLTGEQQKNDFGLVFELFNTLQWDESSSSSVVGYFVYRNGSKIASLDASTLEYQDHNRKKGAKTVYSVTAFDAAGNESTPINVTIK